MCVYVAAGRWDNPRKWWAEEERGTQDLWTDVYWCCGMGGGGFAGVTCALPSLLGEIVTCR